MMSAERRLPVSPRLGWALVALLMVAWIGLQTLGLMHRVVHAPKMSNVVAQSVPNESSGTFAAIWGDHGSSAECQMYDQICPDLVASTAWGIEVAAPHDVWDRFARDERFALDERFYAARGPPVALS